MVGLRGASTAAPGGRRCASQRNGGYSVDGSFGTYMLVDAAFAARIPDGVDPVEVAPILCAGVTVYKG